MNKTVKNTVSLGKRILYICFGALLSALIINGLYLPNQLLSGGIAGIAMLVHLTLSWDTALVTLLINLPVFIAGYLLMDKAFIFFSMIGMLALSFFLKITADIPPISENILVVIALGGALYGFAIALVSLQHASCGGNDIITRILHKYFAVPLGTSTLIINLSILGASIYFFGIDITVLTLISNFVYSASLNYFSEKRFCAKMLIIRSQSAQQIRTALSSEHKLEFIMLTDQSQIPVLIIFLMPKDLPKVRNAAHQIDANAVISVSHIEHIQGQNLFTRQLHSYKAH